MHARFITRLSEHALPAPLPLVLNYVQRAPANSGLWYFLELWWQLRRREPTCRLNLRRPRSLERRSVPLSAPGPSSIHLHERYRYVVYPRPHTHTHAPS